MWSFASMSTVTTMTITGQKRNSCDTGGLDVNSREYQDAHEKAHANDIKKRFANRSVTTGHDYPVSRLTGGLIPCPAYYRSAALHPGEGIYARCRAGTVFQHRFSDHAGFSGRSGGFQRSSGNQTLEWRIRWRGGLHTSQAY
jgi:hypothetical protein